MNFADCIRENLKKRRFGKERADEIIADFEMRANVYKAQGRDATTAYTLAMSDTFQNISDQAVEKAKRTAKMLAVQAQNNQRIKQGLDADIKLFDTKDGKKSSRGVALARAAISLIEDDPRFSGLSYATTKETTRGQLYAIMGDVLDKIGKGSFGVQKGTAHLPNIIREVYGENTGDQTAKEVAQAWLKVSDVGVDLFNQAGGSLKKLARYIPQSQNAAKIVKAGEDVWLKDQMDAIDWGKMFWPDGTPIEAKDRVELLKQIYQTFTTDGANKIDDKAFRGRGRAVGNALENHRLLHYKDASSWLNIHEKYGDGNVFDVLNHHIESMAHRTALVETFGPNPELTAMNIEAMVKKHAAGLSAKDKVDADNILKNKFRPMMEVVMRSNPLDPNSNMGALVTGLSNILTAAQLGSASLLAIPGDFMQTAAVRALNGMDLFGGIDYYFKSIASDRKFMQQIATQSGFVMDEAVTSTYATTRFSGMATVGPAITRRISDTIMRASMMSGHTKSARWAAQAEFMGLLHRVKDTPFDKLPFMAVMERYGITAPEWDAFRGGVKAWEPRKDVKFLRPIDIVGSGMKNEQALFRKFQGMVFEEARKMVPESTIEATVTLKNTTRPDTIAGLLLHSFAMYKNFPVSFWMIYGRLGMTSPNVKGRLSFYAGLGAGMTMVGALGVQMREVAQGRDPMAMDDPKFLGKAFLSGGAMSIWGDFLFGGVNRQGSTPEETAAGPILGFLGDTTQLAFGDLFQWADNVGSLDAGEKGTQFPAKAVEYAKRYTPGSNVWWARLALERQVWDRLQELADPKAYAKQQRKVRNQEKNFGNEYWWAPGDRTPDRLPHYQGRD